MEYLLFAFLALLMSACNTVFNRLSANNVSTVLSAFLKAIFITLACFLICACLGHVGNLYDFNPKQWLFIILTGLLTCSNWIFYFAAIKRSHLEAFSPFVETAVLFFANILFFIPPFFKQVTNGGALVNGLLYGAGLLCLGTALAFIVFNRHINPSVKKKWVIFALISSFSLALTMFFVKWQLSDVPSDQIAFHQMSIVLIVSFVFVAISKETKYLKKLKWQDYMRFFLAALFNSGLMIFRYKALTFESCIPSIVNIIIGLEFIVVSLATVLFFKAHNKKQMLLLMGLVVIGMGLNLLSGLI